MTYLHDLFYTAFFGRVALFVVSMDYRMFTEVKRCINDIYVWLTHYIMVPCSIRYLNVIACSLQHRAIISWWRHQMETFSALLAICAGNSPVTGEFPAKGQWHGALVFSLTCAWINGWVNTHEAGDLRHHHAHYDVTVMWTNTDLLSIGLLGTIFSKIWIAIQTCLARKHIYECCLQNDSHFVQA